jgi:predicted GH43/DUF377 family glycosyl hydrolase
VTPRIYITLGRLGDILNVLPLLHLDAQSGQRNAIMVAKEFAPLFDGISYCDCIPYDGDWQDLEGAVAKAKTLSEDVKCCQVAGDPYVVRRLSFEPIKADKAITDSFQKEAWRLLGRLDVWKTQPPLIFDRRDKERENKLTQTLLPNKKKLILVALSGHTSPFPYTNLAFELLRLKFNRTHDILDLSTVKADKFFDLLGLYEHADALVCSDSAPLHLAYAAQSLPVVALVNDKPSLWHGAAWRANHIAHIRYSDFPNRAVDMLTAISGIGKLGSYFACDLYPWSKRSNKLVIPESRAKIVHVWSQYEWNEENKARHETAKATWRAMAESRIFWVECPIEVGSVGYDSGTQFKDDKRYPLVKDVIRMACMRAGDGDTILLTRCDTAIVLAHPIVKPSWSHRMIREESGDTFHPAADLFAFTKHWWNEHAKEYPNLIMGMDPHWHMVLLALLKKHGGIEIQNAIYRAPSIPITVSPKSTHRLAYNESLAGQFWEANGKILEPPPIIAQASGGVSINRHAIRSYAYNPSLIRFGKRLMMAYRWHPEHETQTRLAMAELDEKLNVTSNKDIFVEGRSVEDPRLFLRGEQLWTSFVDSSWPEINPKSVVKIACLVEHDAHWTVENVQQLPYGKNDWSAMEKNHIYFEHDGKLLCIYASAPKQVVYNGEANPTSLDGARWPWGTLRGGTKPIPYGDKALRFFHSGLDNEPGRCRRRYYVGAMLVEPFPPFAPIKVSKRPILYGSENDDLNDMERISCAQYKAKVVFPAGVVAVDDGWLLSVGCNDAQCAVVKIQEKDLNL